MQARLTIIDHPQAWSNMTIRQEYLDGHIIYTGCVDGHEIVSRSTPEATTQALLRRLAHRLGI